MSESRLLTLAALAMFVCTLAGAEPRWRLRYFHDEIRSTLVISDLKFPSPRRGLAVGALQEEQSTKPVMVSTNDGGATWSIQKLRDHPLSLFFLNDSLGWMVTARGVWRTDEGGLQWNKVSGRSGILRVYFLNENRGFAIGPRKTILETSDGGKSWSALKAAEKVSTSTANTVFTAMDFLGGRFGIIAGWSQPPRRYASRLPDWMDPESALKRRELPASTIVLETRDGGANWNSQVTSMFGRINLLRISPAASALSVFEFDDSFEYPSEVFCVDLRTGKSWRVLREKDRMATDAYEDGEGNAYIAAIECAGKLRRSPIPGKLMILRSVDLKAWHEMPVDYRAVAHRAILAAAGPAHIWAATDTGMILKLER